ncbi:hypothetical protein CQ14_15225 [Bradyrhizobium lablabi]|uniref:Uncharacterized protein n=1 Tax=Bradyrhizobium lablabi TaxID=722472 RepID=A0A0R3MVK9_9BRAD|nr:hypothetical protein CQ14_15225 [Bradyrhizobium lablabi]
MLLRAPMQSDNCFSMIRPLVHSRASLPFKMCVQSPQPAFSNDQVESSAPLSKRLRSRRDIGSKDTAVALCGV